jgi:hypothetical protein
LQIWRNSLSLQRFRFTIRVIVESGLLYTITSIVTFCLELMPSDEGALAIASAIVCINGLIARIASHPRTQNFPVAGIAYNLILMRVVQHSAKPEEHTSTFIGNLTFESNKKTETDGTDPIPAELVV